MRVQVPPPPNLKQTMCICINCEFYKTCWMKKGLYKINPYFDSYLIPLTTINNNLIVNSCLEINLILNLFLISKSLELDVIECSAFCENGGKWI